ncbi:efflux RND transporter periplasmic adaptor subunit [Pseudoalteromonas xiamenensis]|uniref:efflux RND transporter periplasmic adaptor subunit n=1 Tax=Pseudoalteromonas xiamenensis TaxID=882626 RepID=UPI0035E580E5
MTYFFQALDKGSKKIRRLSQFLFFASVICTNRALAEHKVEAEPVLPWKGGEQTIMYCRTEATFRHILSSHAEAEVKWILPVGSKVKKGELVAVQHDFYLEQRQKILKAEIESAENNYLYDLEEFNRLKLLGKQELISSSDLDSLELAYRQAQLRAQTLKVELSTVQYQLLHLKHYAPFDGVVSSINIQPGSWAVQGQTVLDLTPEVPNQLNCRLTLTLFEEYERLNDARFYLDNEELSLLRISNELDIAGQFMTVYLRLPEAQQLFFGQRITVALEKPRIGLFQISYDALNIDAQTYFVWSIDNNNLIHKHLVEVKRTIPQGFVVRSDLQEGDRVILNGKKGLKESMKVEMREEKKH